MVKNVLSDRCLFVCIILLLDEGFTLLTCVTETWYLKRQHYHHIPLKIIQSILYLYLWSSIRQGWFTSHLTFSGNRSTSECIRVSKPQNYTNASTLLSVEFSWECTIKFSQLFSKQLSGKLFKDISFHAKTFMLYLSI